MGTIIGRTRKDGSKAFVAQIVIKKAGAIVHREAETFDRKQAANAWIVKREAELKRPDGLEHKEDPALAAVIDRYIAESKNAVLGTKAQVLKSIKNSDLGETNAATLPAVPWSLSPASSPKMSSRKLAAITSRTFRTFSPSPGRHGAIRCLGRNSMTPSLSSRNWD